MGTEGRTITESCLSEEQWNIAQEYEAQFWSFQKSQDNREQRERNNYYRNVLEDACKIARDFFAQDFSDSIIADVGSGPKGILHVLKAKKKIAIDPLMRKFFHQGYDTSSDDVECIEDMGETFILDEPADYITCLNALDHMRDPAITIQNIAERLLSGGELLLITDLRTEEFMDACHQLAVTYDDVMTWIEPYFGIVEKELIGHGDGTINKTKQLVLRCRKYS